MPEISKIDLPRCRWINEDLATIRRDDCKNIVVVAYVSWQHHTILYSVWTPCASGREYWTKREINGAMYGQVGTEWPHYPYHVYAADDAIRWMLTEDFYEVMQVVPDHEGNALSCTDCEDSAGLSVYVNVLTDIEHVVRDCQTVRQLERIVSHEKVMA